MAEAGYCYVSLQRPFEAAPALQPQRYYAHSVECQYCASHPWRPQPSPDPESGQGRLLRTVAKRACLGGEVEVFDFDRAVQLLGKAQKVQGLRRITINLIAVEGHQ